MNLFHLLQGVDGSISPSWNQFLYNLVNMRDRVFKCGR